MSASAMQGGHKKFV